MKTRVIYYSPCGTTARLANAVAAGLGYQDAVGVDLSVPENRRIPYESGLHEVTVFAFPVYHKALPELCLPYLQKLGRGGNSPVILLLNTGGEGAGTALEQLHYLVAGSGFTVVAAAEFVSRHAFAPSLNTGRPNEADIEAAVELGRLVAEKLNSDIEPIKLGKQPTEPALFWPSFPIVTTDKCTGCKLCAKSCVSGAINPRNPRETDAMRCTMCMRCVFACPEGSRTLPDEDFKSKSRFIELTGSTKNARVYI